MCQMCQEGGNQKTPSIECLLPSISMKRNLTSNSTRNLINSSKASERADVPEEPGQVPNPGLNCQDACGNSNAVLRPEDCMSMLRFECGGVSGCAYQLWSAHAGAETGGLKEHLRERLKRKKCEEPSKRHFDTLPRRIHVYEDLSAMFHRQALNHMTSGQKICLRCGHGNSVWSIRSLVPTRTIQSNGDNELYSGYGKTRELWGKRCYSGISWSTTERSYFKDLSAIVRRSRISARLISMSSLYQDRPRIQTSGVSKISRTASI